MYIFADMIDLGLPEGEIWSSEDHRVVAQNIGLCNPRVTTRDSLTEIVIAINKIPQCAIRHVTAADLAEKYAVPFISIS